MKRLTYILGFLALVLLGIQLVPNELPEVQIYNTGDLIQSGLVSEDVAGLLKTSCYDCHSNETVYPWYSKVAPTSWLVAKDVREGREELNFSYWAEMDLMKQLGKLDDIAEAVENGKMPMEIYVWMHKSAKLTDAQRELIVAWAEGAMDTLVEEGEEDFEFE
ncbi:heme-binding domain-containing protein [Cecembia rubra]|uniref:Heme-binding protein n=1 Tax=Cecembia rubra TaxID=1485585 RepID=A0A2P8ED17_9BACT|nr:heme-binding domain-containing protein [Cecembia rubra]PSL07375.1 heme-binding protein [Cecembia rubra]